MLQFSRAFTLSFKSPIVFVRPRLINNVGTTLENSYRERPEIRPKIDWYALPHCHSITHYARSRLVSTVYQLATISPTNPPTPNVRTIAHRGFLSFNAARPLLITSTDIRTPKASQIATNPNIELTWWFSGPVEQYRIRGKAWILPSQEATKSDQGNLGIRDGQDEEKETVGTTAKVLLDTFPGTRLRGDEVNYDWEQKRKEVFNSMSGHMRAAWARPIPGSDLPSDNNNWPETLPGLDDDETQANKQTEVAYAFKNFALVVIEPEEVDYVELGVMPNRRTVFRYTEKEEWVETAVVP